MTMDSKGNLYVFCYKHITCKHNQETLRYGIDCIIW